MYTVIHLFADIEDANHIYEVGDKFPRPSANVSAERIAELSGSHNRLGKPLIRLNEKAVEVQAKAAPKRKRKEV